MTPRQVKDALCAAVKANDPLLAWPTVQDLVKQDLYIQVRKMDEAGEPCLKPVRHGPRPCSCGCGQYIPKGTLAWWTPNIGVAFREHVGK